MERELVVKAALAVLEKYGDDSYLSHFVEKGRENGEIFDPFCVQLIDTFRPLTAQSRVKALSNFHQLCVTVVRSLWNKCCTELQIPVVQAVTTQSVNRHLLNLILVERNSGPVYEEKLHQL